MSHNIVSIEYDGTISPHCSCIETNVRVRILPRITALREALTIILFHIILIITAIYYAFIWLFPKLIQKTEINPHVYGAIINVNLDFILSCWLFFMCGVAAAAAAFLSLIAMKQTPEANTPYFIIDK